MSDAITLPISPSVLSATADVVGSRPVDDELLDEDLDQSVGGLTRTWNANMPSMLDVGPAYTVARLDARDLTQCISA